MDSFEINKIVAAILMVGLLVIGLDKVSDLIFTVEKPETPGYAIEVEQAKTVSNSTKAVTEEKIDIAALMAFAGLRKEKDRASVILYLNQNSDNPLPLP